MFDCIDWSRCELVVGGIGSSIGSTVEARGDPEGDSVSGAAVDSFSNFLRLVGLRRTTGVVVQLNKTRKQN